MSEPLNATIIRRTTEYTPNIIDAHVKGQRTKGTTRFVEEEDGTWATWTQAGELRRKMIHGSLFFQLRDDQLYPLTWPEVDAIRAQMKEQRHA